MSRIVERSVVVLAVVALGACTEYGTRSYGVGRGGQEQTRVTSPAPLSLPPILTEARAAADAPPAEGGAVARGSDGTATGPGAARRTPASPPTSGAPPSSGEESLLDASGPSAPGDIRQKVDQDAQLGRAAPGYSDALLFGPTGPRVAGQAPIIQREGRGSWLDAIF